MIKLDNVLEQAQTSAAMLRSASAASELLQTASITSGWTPAASGMTPRFERPAKRGAIGRQN
jgi:hypothetical protein